MSPQEAVVALLVLVGFFYSMIAHEVAHAWVALKCGDATAYREGRITADPVKHVDPIMTIALPILTYLTMGVPFGGAKPVPFVPWRLRSQTRDLILVSMAGIAANLLIALVCGIVIRGLLMARAPILVAIVFEKIAMANVGLFVFNLIPIPPLDGSRVFRFLLKGKAQDDYDRLGQLGIGIVLVAVLVQVPQVREWLAYANQLVAQLLGIP